MSHAEVNAAVRVSSKGGHFPSSNLDPDMMHFLCRCLNSEDKQEL